VRAQYEVDLTIDEPTMSRRHAPTSMQTAAAAAARPADQFNWTQFTQSFTDRLLSAFDLERPSVPPLCALGGHSSVAAVILVI